MSSSSNSFSRQEFIAPRKRYKFGIMDEESDGSGSSLDSVGNSETPLLSAFPHFSYATPFEILRRMALSLVPPLHPSRVLMKPLLDPVGPTVVITILICLLSYASSKTEPFKYRTLEALTIVGLYMIISSSVVFFFGHMFTGGRYNISFLKISILLGYSLIGHVLSLVIPFALYSYKDPSPEPQLGAVDQVMGRIVTEHASDKLLAPLSGGESSDVPHNSQASALRENLNHPSSVISGQTKSNESGDSAFLICLPFLAGPATLRVALVLLSPIQSPPGRMILGTILCLCHLLLLIILHASFVHPTFQYGAKG
ncbi:uncharacterized protein LOC124169865 [Ischnura elegans]|uniref:uncharacterized protein LOC124169865 n=1 Tax=Ischnura elegans TaxID=197161 RepID=UPI001ED874D1|nr:uncharacterized protein LOC124169865 [Ischnura elegans]